MNPSLKGLRIVNTRATHQAATLDRLLAARGAVPLPYPCIAIKPPIDPEPLKRALAALVGGEFDWLVLTSANTVEALAMQGVFASDASAWRTAVVGAATARAVRRRLGVTVDFMSQAYDAASLAREMPAEPGNRVLAPGSEIARQDVPALLEARGVEVTVVTAYRTLMGSGGVNLPALVQEGKVDVLTFASPSAVRGFMERAAAEGAAVEDVLHLPCACIGGTTSAAAREFGFTQVLEAREATAAGVVEAIEERMMRDA